MNVGWKHDDLARDLREHLAGNSRERMCWLDMQLGPSGSPRPDVYSIDKSYSRFVATAFECKVSRSDFLADVTAGKWQSYYAYAGSVVFAVPDGLVKVTEIPDAAGLIVRKGDTWRYAKKARHQVLDNLPRSAWMKLLMDGVDRVALRRHKEASEHVVRERAMKAALGEEITKLVQRGDFLKYEIEAEAQNHARRMESIRQRNATVEAEARDKDRAASQIWSELCVVFDMPPSSNEWAVRQRMRNVVAMLDADARVSQLARVIDNAVRSLSDARLHLNCSPETADDAPAGVEARQ